MSEEAKPETDKPKTGREFANDPEKKTGREFANDPNKKTGREFADDAKENAKPKNPNERHGG